MADSSTKISIGLEPLDTKWPEAERRSREIVASAPGRLWPVEVFKYLVDEGLLQPCNRRAYVNRSAEYEGVTFRIKTDWTPILAHAQELVAASPGEYSSRSLYDAMRDGLDGADFHGFQTHVCYNIDGLIKLDRCGNQRKDWASILKQAADIVNSYTDTGVILRSLFYRLVAAQVFPDTGDAYYKNLGRHISEARLAGKFPDLVDDGRAIEGDWGQRTIQILDAECSR